MAPNKRRPVAARTVLKDPACLLAFGLGTGLMPVAPGTFGTLLGIPVYLVLAGFAPWVYGLALALMLGAGVFLCSRCEQHLGVQDHSGIVWDEIVGVLITLWGVQPTWHNIAVGFVLFRVFDVLKPWPIRWFDQRVHGGFGIMLDDVLAGAFGWAAFQVLRPWVA